MVTKKTKSNRKANLKRAAPAKKTAKVKVQKRVSVKATPRKAAKTVVKPVQKPAPKAKKEVEQVDTANVKEVEAIIGNGSFVEFVSKNIGKQGVTLLSNLNEAPHTDDKLALKMNIKVNEVRRMLNVLNGYGITKYDINKDGKGWLTFRWYIDRPKLMAFHSTLVEKQNSEGMKLQEDCNDFFYCLACYNDQKVILPFDSAFEAGFKCDCGKSLAIIDKSKAVEMFRDAPQM